MRRVRDSQERASGMREYQGRDKVRNGPSGVRLHQGHNRVRTISRVVENTH